MVRGPRHPNLREKLKSIASKTDGKQHIDTLAGTRTFTILAVSFQKLKL